MCIFDLGRSSKKLMKIPILNTFPLRLNLHVTWTYMEERWQFSALLGSARTGWKGLKKIANTYKIPGFNLGFLQGTGPSILRKIKWASGNVEIS